MKTAEEIKAKLKDMEENTNLTNLQKNLYWEQALKWVLEEWKYD